MRYSWIENNRSRNIIDWERTKNDVRDVVSLFYNNLVHTSTSGGRCRLGDEDLRGWLATIVVVVASGMWWSVLELVLVLGTVSRVVTHLATLVENSKDSEGTWFVWWSWVEWSWWTRRHKGWPRWVVLAEHTIGDPIFALLRA